MSDVFLRSPVFKTLMIPAEPGADLPCGLVDHHAPSRVSERDGCGESGGAAPTICTGSSLAELLTISAYGPSGLSTS